jgi:formylglycine-generating enzyme required for sulfatase activity
MFERFVLAIAVAAASPSAAAAQEAARVRLGAFAIDRTEVTVAAFARYAAARGVVTAAERDGGGHEYLGGWVRRPGWTFRAPSGAPAAPNDPAAHVTWAEASHYCAHAGGRLPRLAEWREAAYTERRAAPTDGFERGRTYRYPVGDEPAGMNGSGADPWPRHAPAGATKRGVNGLYDMGGNLWEWLADRRGDEALTAGGSWWYGPAQAEAGGTQWKAAEFNAVYIGFRCVYDAR